MQAFPKAKLERAVVKLFEADRSLRDARPDDRIVMEEMILALTNRPVRSGTDPAVNGAVCSQTSPAR